jgi:hypothetical protein
MERQLLTEAPLEVAKVETDKEEETEEETEDE